MADPNRVSNIGMKVAAANAGEFVTLRNLSNGQKLVQKLSGSDSSTIFNAAPASEWAVGDDIQGEIRGSVSGSLKTTIKAVGTILKIVATEDVSTPGVPL